MADECNQTSGMAGESKQTSGMADEPNQTSGMAAKSTHEDREQELIFLRAAGLGDHVAVLSILNSSPSFNPDCVDVLGRTALRLAVKDQHFDIVNLLLDVSNVGNVYEALLLAISMDHDAISETIIRHAKYAEYKRYLQEKHSLMDDVLGTPVDDTIFSTDVTPLMLAAQKNQFQIVKLLILLGETIPEPHNPDCRCVTCREVSRVDELRVARARLNAYRGLSSAVYITLASKDPILTTFLLSKRLKQLAIKEKHFKAEYTHLNEQVGDFQIRLLDRIRSEEELDVVLNEKEGSSFTDTHKMARLTLAIHYEQKKFVAHSYCQKKLTSMWYSGMEGNHFMDYKVDNKFVLFLKAILFVMLYPFLAIVYWISPNSRVGHFLQIPVLKFTASAYSYIFFVIIIIAYSATERPSAGYKLSEDAVMGPLFQTFVNDTAQPQFRDMFIRNHRIGYGTFVLTLWIIGLIWQDCKEIYNSRLDYHFESWFNILDLTFLTLYVTSFTLRYLTLTKVQYSVEYFQKASSWQNLQDYSSSALYRLYWMDADRYYWDQYDPYILSEAVFAFANVLSVCRLAGLLIVSERIGPMIISLSGMAYDFARFAVFFMLMILAFIVAFLNLYWYYNPSQRAKAEVIKHDELPSTAGETFGDLETIFRTVYWSIFGMAEPQSVEVGAYPFENVTNTVGYLLFGIYNWVTVLIFVNILIAMMARSYEVVVEDEDVEWKFARTKVYMDFMRSGSTLAVPFNIVPSWKSMLTLISHLRELCCRGDASQTDDDTKEEGDLNGLAMTDLDSGQANKALDADSEKDTSGEMDKRDEVLTQCHLDIQGVDEGESSSDGIDREDIDVNVDVHSQTPSRESIDKMKKMSIAESVLFNPDQLTDHELVTKRLIRRYLIHVHGSGGTETDMADESESQDHHEEIKKDLSNLRFELVNLLRRRERDSGEVDGKINQLWDELNSVDQKCNTIIELLKDVKEKSDKSQNQNVAQPSRWDQGSKFMPDEFGGIPSNVQLNMESSSSSSGGHINIKDGKIVSGDVTFNQRHLVGNTENEPFVTTTISGRLSPASVFAELQGAPLGTSLISSGQVHRVQQVQHVRRIRRVQNIVTTERKVQTKKVSFGDDNEL